MALLTMTLGCRGSYPLARSVQVTHDPAVELPEFAAPPQRLATAKPRVGSEVLRQSSDARGHASDPSESIESNGGVAAVSHIDDSSAATRSVSTSTTKTMQYAADANRAAAKTDLKPNPSDRTVVREGNTQVESIRKTISSNPRLDSAQNAHSPLPGATLPTGAPLPAGASEMLEAFKNSPPEVQQQALLQLIAATSRTEANSSTTQKEGVVQASFNDLATSSSKPSPSNTSPVPIANATDEPTDSSTSVSLSHQSESVSPNPSVAKTASHVSDAEVHVEALAPTTKSLAATGTETTGAHSSLSHKSKPKSEETKPIESEPATITSTLAAPSATTTPSMPTSVVSFEENGKDAHDVGVLSESQLYSELLSRLNQSTPDETDAARSRRLVMLRHLMVLSGNVDGAVSKIEGMTENEQEYLRHQLLGLWTIIDPDGHPVPGRRFSAALPQLREATTQLAAATDSLDVRSLAFCTEIESYGQIKKFPTTRFKPGQQVILYCEIENFVASKVANGFETNLQGSYDVFNEAGEKVASQLLPADRQVSNNYLRDYFIAYQMFLPKDLGSGKFRLQLTIEDLNGKKYGQSMIPFELAR